MGRREGEGRERQDGEERARGGKGERGQKREAEYIQMYGGGGGVKRGGTETVRGDGEEMGVGWRQIQRGREEKSVLRKPWKLNYKFKIKINK